MTEEQINALINGLDKEPDGEMPDAVPEDVPSERKPSRTASMLVRATLSDHARADDSAPDTDPSGDHGGDDDATSDGPGEWGLHASEDAWERAEALDRRAAEPTPEHKPESAAVETSEAMREDAGPTSIEVEVAPSAQHAESAEAEGVAESAGDDADATLAEQMDATENAPAADAESQSEEEPVQLRVSSKRVSLRLSKPAPGAKPQPEDDRKPRIMIMGEFSAGKSTLMNLLLGEPALPVNATATQLPPVWITKGENGVETRVDVDGSEEPADLTRPDSIPLADTHYIRVQKSADLLDMCDLIDTPGISDPNMPIEVWQRMIQHADAIVWCTHATQAWRQSEAAAWSMLPEKLHKRSLLLLTRFDKITSDRDRIRVIQRVKRETEGLFRDLFPISLTEAIEAGDDRDAFAAAGGESFADALFEVIGLIQRKDASVRTRPRSQLAPFKLEPEPEPVRVVTPRRVKPRPLAARPLGGRRSSGLSGSEQSL